MFFGLLALVFVASATFLLWPASPDGYDDLTPAELRVLAEAARTRLVAPESTAGGRASNSAFGSDAGPVSGSEATSEPTSGSAVLHIDSTPSGALVSVDGAVAGVTPLRLRNLSSGRHLVSVEQTGFQWADTLVYVGGGLPTSVLLTLAPSNREEAEAPSQRDVPPSPAETPRPTTPPAPPAPTSGTVTVTVNPAGVPVQLDGRTVGVAPLELGDVAAGPHTLTLFLPGYETSTVRIDVEPGRREVVDVALVPQKGTLNVVVRPWGSIYVDGTLRARDTDVSFETTLPVGSHRIRVEHPGLGVQERTVEVQPDRTTSAVFDLN